MSAFLEKYGIAIFVLVIVGIMVALASPLGSLVENTIHNEVKKFTNTTVEDYKGGESETETELDLSTVNTDLTTNTWEDVQKVVKAGKTEEAGWTVGSTKSVTINGTTKTATLIGVDHDGKNTVTFMVTESIGTHVMNSVDTNKGGWKDSEMRAWLNGDIYNSMTDVKDYIKSVNKLTDNYGTHYEDGERLSETQDKVFLLSAKEYGLGYPPEYSGYSDVFNNEGITYTNMPLLFDVWFRSPESETGGFFVLTEYGPRSKSANMYYDVLPVFVIG